MKAIVLVNQKSQYARYNNLTFEVVELLQTIVALDIDGRKMDFSFNEVIIVDFENELQRSFNNFNWGAKSDYNNLVKYKEFKNILFNPEYTTYP